MAQSNLSKSDPVRIALANLIYETHTPFTPDSIIREFRATDGKRISDRELLILLESISFRRPNFREVLVEIKDILTRKDPVYALMVFIERINNAPNRPGQSQISGDMPPPPRNTRDPLDDLASGTSSLQEEVPSEISSLDLQSPPGTSRQSDDSSGPSTSFERRRVPTDSASARGDLSQIKQRVLNAVSTSADQKYEDIMGRNKAAATSNGASGSSKSGNTNSGSSKSGGSKSGGAKGGSSTSGSTTPHANSDNSSNGSTIVPSPRSNGANDDGRLSSGFKERCNVKDTDQKSNVSSHGLPDEYRTTMIWDYYDVGVENTLPQPNLAALPVDTQQELIMADLIFTLIGMRGSYIVPLPRDPNATDMDKYETHFTVHKELDKSLSELVQQILPLASYFMGVQRAMAATEGRGQVINALNAALQEIVQDFYVLVSNVETEMNYNRLTLSKLLYYLQPTTWLMKEIFITMVTVQREKYVGAAVLTYLCNRIKHLEGDKTVQDALIMLATKASVPYMEMLQIWIQKGVIVDRAAEFLVKDNEVVHKNELPEHYSDDYWEKRYTVRAACIPQFLEGHSDKIMRTGKYLNVIRQCGKRVMATQRMDLKFEPTSEQHVAVINDAYYFAARMLLDVLLTENDLMGHLLSVKRYLLLNQGDFIMQFMDACEEELSKNVDHVLPITLENLLGLTLRLSSARSDPYKDYLHCGLLTYDLVTQMSKIVDLKEDSDDSDDWRTGDRLDLIGIECFAFTYEVKWPVSLVLNHIAITKYQMLFRQLFYCKHVERQLCKIWKANSIAKKFSPQAAELYRSAFTLRQRMMNAVQNLEYYMLIEIIEPNWHIFIEKMKKVENVDMVLSLHQDFLDLCLKNCMLTETSHLNRAIFKLCKICLKFCEFIQSETAMDETDTFGERVKRFDLEFTGMLITFLKQINDLAKDNTTDLYMNLVHRINFNGFYSDQMEKLCVEKAMG